ncbi:hypothetical protein CCL23_18915 [Pseudomonas syringae]|nr:hypothetical protein CCL23_18915 [Pseudomonas syringae]
MRPNAEALGVVHRFLWERCAAGDGTPPYLMTTYAPTLKRLALYTNLVGASLLAKAIVQTPCFLWLHWPIREQARSHRTEALPGTARRRI